MSETGTFIVFGVVVAAALGLMSYVLWKGAAGLGHPPGRVTARLVLLWLSVAGAVLVGLGLRHVFHGGLFDISFSRQYDTPWFQLSGPGAEALLVLGLAVMALCAGVGLWAISSLQHPADLSAREEEGQAW